MKVQEVLILMAGFLSVCAGNSDSGSLEELQSLPYLAWSDKPDTRPSGVVKFNKNKAYDGYNFYTDLSNNVYLMDMTGRMVYSWKLPSTGGMWQFARLLNDGSIVAVKIDDRSDVTVNIGGRDFAGLPYGGLDIAKIDKNSKLVWETPVPANHDVEVLADGTFLVPADESPRIYHNRHVFFNSIVHVSKDGKILGKWSTYDHLKELQKLHLPLPLDSDKRDVINKGPINDRRSYDYYHLNSIQVLPDTALGLKDGRFQKGNWLVGSRHVNLVFIVDKDTHKVVWGWGPGVLDGPHMPRMLNNGNILIFDNGLHRSYSRVIIIDPVAGKIVWEYKGNPPESFYSRFQGSSQQLSNGDLFICESDRGHAFEMAPSGEIVWEFFNPEVNKYGRRKTIYRMTRIPKQEVSGWLNRTRK